MMTTNPNDDKRATDGGSVPIPRTDEMKRLLGLVFGDDRLKLLPGTEVGRYVVGEEIHSSRNAFVAHCVDPLTPNRRLVVKTFVGESHEIEILSTISHDGIPILCDVVDDPSGIADHAIIMPYCGVSAATWVSQFEGRSLARSDTVAALDIICVTCDALIHLHESGIAHYDVKPTNICIRPTASPCLIDYHSAGPIMGPAPGSLTIQYVPEHLRDDSDIVHNFGVHYDIYALAITACELLEGRSGNDRPKNVRCRNRHISRSLTRFFSKFNKYPLPSLEKFRAELDAERDRLATPTRPRRVFLSFACFLVLGSLWVVVIATRPSEVDKIRHHLSVGEISAATARGRRLIETEPENYRAARAAAAAESVAIETAMTDVSPLPYLHLLENYGPVLSSTDLIEVIERCDFRLRIRDDDSFRRARDLAISLAEERLRGEQAVHDQLNGA